MAMFRLRYAGGIGSVALTLTVHPTLCNGDASSGLKRSKTRSKLFSSRVISRKEVGSTKWLKLQTILYRDQTGKERFWDVCTRTTREASVKSSGVDAVVILALLHSASRQQTDTLIVEQFRPPVGKVTIELPAGLVDAGEEPEEAALRELKEETGYIGNVVSCSAPVCMSPGLTDESVKTVVVNVDLDDPVNAKPSQSLEDTEFISVKRVPLKTLTQELENLEAQGSMAIEGLHLFALGLQMGQQLAGFPGSLNLPKDS